MLSSTESDLLDAVKESLSRNGVLSSLKARIRAEISETLTRKDYPSKGDAQTEQSDSHFTNILPAHPKELYLINELIRDYFLNLKCDSTLSVMSHELGQNISTNPAVDRTFIAGELGYNATQCDKNVPLLLLLVKDFIRLREKREMDNLRSLSSKG